MLTSKLRLDLAPKLVSGILRQKFAQFLKKCHFCKSIQMNMPMGSETYQGISIQEGHGDKIYQARCFFDCNKYYCRDCPQNPTNVRCPKIIIVVINISKLLTRKHYCALQWAKIMNITKLSLSKINYFSLYKVKTYSREIV